MKFRDYKSAVLKKQNRIIDLFLLLFLSLSISGLIFIGMGHSMINHFEYRSEFVADEIVTFLSENSKELISSQLEEENLCEVIDYSQIADQISEDVWTAMCANGPITLKDFPIDILSEEVNKQIQDLKPEIQAQFDEQIALKKEALENTEKKYPFLDMIILQMIFCALLILYLVNNDVVITLHYLAHKLIFLVPSLFILPYLLFRFNFLSSFVNGVGFEGLIQTPLPIDTGVIVNKVLEIMSSEMTLFYKQYLVFAIVAIFAGMVLWICNKYFILPVYAKKHNISLEYDKKK